MSNLADLLPVYTVALILAACSHMFSQYDRSLERYRKKEHFCYVVMVIILIIFAGMRTRYNDTRTYVETYELFPVYLDKIVWSLGDNPGFVFVMGVLQKLGASSQTFLLFFSALTLGIYFWFFKKYSNNILFTVFLFLVFAGFTFTLAAIKQCMAVAFCLVAVDRALKKKWVPFVLWILLASTFHPYSLMYLVVPYLICKPWCKRTYWTVLVFALAGILLEILLGTLLDITSMLGEEYDASSFVGEGVNPFRLIVVSVPLIISFLARNYIAKMDEKQETAYFLFVNLAILNAEIMFVALFGTANYFARLANYFAVFQALSIPWLLRFFDKKSRSILTVIAVFSYLFFFYYENALNFNFSRDFDRITLIEYLLKGF